MQAQAPSTLLIYALGVVTAFGDSKMFGDYRMITRYVDKFIRIEAAQTFNEGYAYIIVKQFYPRQENPALVLTGYLYEDSRPPRVISMSATPLERPERRSFHPGLWLSRPAPLIPWERRLTTLYRLHRANAVGLRWWDMSIMDDNPNWSQLTIEGAE